MRAETSRYNYCSRLYYVEVHFMVLLNTGSLPFSSLYFRHVLCHFLYSMFFTSLDKGQTFQFSFFHFVRLWKTFLCSSAMDIQYNALSFTEGLDMYWNCDYLFCYCSYATAAFTSSSCYILISQNGRKMVSGWVKHNRDITLHLWIQRPYSLRLMSTFK